MELGLRRIARKAAYTIGRLYIDGAYFCDTLEDTDRDANRNGVFDGGERYGLYQRIGQRGESNHYYIQYVYLQSDERRADSVSNSQGVDGSS